MHPLLRLSLIALAFNLPAFAYADRADTADGGMSDGALDALDNTPDACAGMPLIDGQTMENILEKDTKWCKENKCAETNKKLKQNEAREKLAAKPETVGGKLSEGTAVDRRRNIDGPANLRDKPNGKVIGSFANKFPVLIVGQGGPKGDWFYIRGYWAGACETGWTHEKNLKPFVNKP